MSIIQGLKKTRQLFHWRSWGAKKEQREHIEAQIEESLLLADCSLETTDFILSEIRRLRHLNPSDAFVKVTQEILDSVTCDFDFDNPLPQNNPLTLLLVGVNGSGKTTTIGKLAHQFKQSKKQALLISADTFRAAAHNQLSEWANRIGVTVANVSANDPSAVIYQGMEQAVKKDFDVVIADTAGRQFNQQNLMQELQKMVRTFKKFDSDMPHQCWLVVDSGSGQNALHQAREFHQAAALDGCIVTKLDGSAKGAMILSLVHELKLPIIFVGVGEQLDDLLPFNATEFINGLVVSSE